jgi:hypothetical protein
LTFCMCRIFQFSLSAFVVFYPSHCPITMQQEKSNSHFTSFAVSIVQFSRCRKGNAQCTMHNDGVRKRTLF